jgi:DNA-binding MarR family transcriptional regulator
MLDKMSDTSRIVDRLICKELVQKNACQSDKRLVDIVLTEKGLKLINKLDILDTQLDAILSGLDENEAVIANQILDKLRAHNDND